MQNDSSVNQRIRKITWLGLVVNLLLSTAKIAAGFFGRSQALIADGIHSLSDMGSDIVILAGIKFWSRPADQTQPHGYRRIETFATMIIGVLLGLTALGFFWQGLLRLQKPVTAIPGQITIITALLSVVVKEWLFRLTAKEGEICNSEVLKANAWHHRSDAFSSIPVFIAVGVAFLSPEWAFLDAIATLFVSGLIGHIAFLFFWPSARKLCDLGAPENFIDNVRTKITATDGVVSAHKIRSRYLDSSKIALDLHIQVSGEISVSDGHKISGLVKKQLLEAFPSIKDVIIHIEPEE
jgi:cation diffusion facilitator family transporter